METQSQPQLRGAALFRKMLDNKKLIQAQMIEDYNNDPEIRAIFKELGERNARKRELNKQRNVHN